MKKFIYSFSMAALFGIYVIAGRTVWNDAPISNVSSSEENIVIKTTPTPTAEAGSLDVRGTTEPTPTPAPSKIPPTLTSTPTPLPTQVPTPTPVQSKPTPTKIQGQYADGNYTGSVEDAYYGNIQVLAVVQNGKLTDVQFLQYPNDRRTSREINAQAMPVLKQEAIAAQSANVDIVSGATDSSNAFVQSLSNALSQAKNS